MVLNFLPFYELSVALSLSCFSFVFNSGRELLKACRNSVYSDCRSGSEVIKLFSCSTQLSRKFFLLINVKMQTIVDILTFMSRKNSILGLSEFEESCIT